MANAANLINFGAGGGTAVGDFFYSLYNLTSPSYLPLNNEYTSYLAASYPTLAALVTTPVATYAATATTLSTSDGGRAVAFGNGVFVTIPGVASISAASSIDGVTWVTRGLPSSAQWYWVTFGKGIFVAIAFGSTAAASSVDGTTWVARTLPSATNWRAVTYGNGIFVVISSGGSGQAATSPDGITWTARVLSAIDSWSAVAFGNGVFVAVATGGTAAATSPDGITWTARTLPSSAGWTAVTFGNGVFVAVVGSSVSTIAASSPDGITWTARTLPSSANWTSIILGGNLGAQFFVATSANGTGAAKITLSVAQTTFTLPVITPPINALSYVKAT